MKILILGAGGIGCYYAARLINAGHELVLTARGEHLLALQNQGLEVTHPDFSFQGGVTAMDTAGLMQNYHCADFDLIIVAFKATATEAVLTELASWLSSGTGHNSVPVLSLQNGVSNEEKIAACVGMERTLGGLAVEIGGHIKRPGIIEATGVSRIEAGAWPNAESNSGWLERLTEFAEHFRAAGIPFEISDDIRRLLWRKLIINNGMNPMSALTGMTTKKMVNNPVFGPLIREIMHETVRAAQQLGVNLVAEDAEAMFQLMQGFDDIKTSMLVDRMKGRPLESDEICGPVIELCRQAGEPAVSTERVHALLTANLNAGF